MKVAQVSKPGGPIEISERPVRDPGPGEVRIRIEACGVCHSDALTVTGAWPGVKYPMIPGHEIAGVIDAIGSGVTTWRKDQRVGVGWHGGHCTVCTPCRRGTFVLCVNLRIPGISYDGGYAEYVVVPIQALAPIPDTLSFADAAPIMCAGITTFNALRHGGAIAGDLVAVEGIGGLGHLGVQFANRMGFETVAIGHGSDKQDLAKKLGAHHYIDSAAGNSAGALAKLGGAKAILATAPDAKAMSELVNGLAVDGTLMLIGAGPGDMAVNPVEMLLKRTGVRGWPAGTSADSEDALRLCAFSGVRPMIETFPLDQAAAAYERMMSGKARFRAVLTMR
jgi:D-arabinose 1-dehydrogenase-like Zn-dependent alcohol dehydrogenase